MLACLDIVDDCAAGGMDLLQIIEGYDRLLLVDSITTREGSGGQLVPLHGRQAAENCTPGQYP